MSEDTGADEVMQAVGKTAQFTAYCRAVETLKDVPLIRDPYANAFAGKYGQYYFEKIREATAHTGVDYIKILAVRTKYMDDEILHAVNKDHVSQVVMVGCGGDSRAYRLDLPATVTVFELDYDIVLQYRTRVFSSLQAKPACHVVPVPCDLSLPSWVDLLIGAGFTPQQPTLWITEGILMYLTIPQIDVLMHAIVDMSGSDVVVIGDVYNSAQLTGPSREAFRSVFNSLGQGAVSYVDIPEEFMVKYGFTHVEAITHMEYADPFGYAVPESLLKLIRSEPRSPESTVPRYHFFTASKHSKHENVQ